MNILHFSQPEALSLLFFVPVILLLIRRSFRKKREAAETFSQISAPSRPRHIRMAVILSLIILFLIIGIAGISWQREEIQIEQEGRDIIFVVDVSRSMLAEDLKPNRLERAKIEILDTQQSVQGERVGLVAFSETAQILSPPTLDYNFFRAMVNQLASVEPARSGTNIESALRKVAEQLVLTDSSRYTDVVLITDGENHIGSPERAAKLLAERGIRLIAIGIGDEKRGSRIPGERDGEYLTFEGEEVWTKLDSKTLRNIASLTPGGRYLHASTKSFELSSIYSELIHQREETATTVRTITRYKEQFQLFFLIALVLMIADSIVRKT